MHNFRNGYDTLDRLLTEFALARADTKAWNALDVTLKEKCSESCYGAIQDADESKPQVRLTNATVLLYAGSAHETLSRHTRALEDLEHARQLLESLHTQDPNDIETREHLSVCYFNISLAKLELGEMQDAERFVQQAIRLMEGLLNADTDQTRVRRRLARQQHFLANLYGQTNRAEQMATTLEAVLALRREIAQERTA